MNLQTLRAKLTKVERQRSKLEQQIQANAKKQLDSLPARVGLKTIDQLILELLPYASPSIRGKVQTNGSGAASTDAATGTGRRRGRPPKNAAPAETSGDAAEGDVKSKGTRYSQDVKDAIKSALEEGGMTVAAISEKYGASPFSINQWKKSWGLTKARRKK
jgi:hypothetical protein